jgi:hypothetical protein
MQVLKHLCFFGEGESDRYWMIMEQCWNDSENIKTEVIVVAMGNKRGNGLLNLIYDPHLV